ncbi:hypothetical protein [Streptomyces sp. NPDC048473]|uniref:hypothetical protein n=1 Tax=unclassified Streptomyces TaxID=2593676 RepID=UPI003710CCC6
MDQEPPHQVSFNYQGIVENLSFELGKDLATQLSATEPPTGAASVRSTFFLGGPSHS